MPFLLERTQFEEELDCYYAGYPTNYRAFEQELHENSACHPEWLPAQRKSQGYSFIAAHCPVKIFRHFPFYFELNTGRARTDLGEGGLGGWMTREPFGGALRANGSAWWTPCYESGLSEGWLVLDNNHHGLGYDLVFRYGLHGLIAQAARRLYSAETEQERVFLESMITGLQALITIAGRFAVAAAELTAEEAETEIRQRLLRIADTARRVPAEPPATFYEALNTILFMREVTQELEGNGISVFGHLDRMLFPFYQRDLAEGRITREEASDLLAFFLAFSDVRFDMKHARNHVGTNSTVVIGGCDAEGSPVYNELSAMILELYAELRLVDPKLNARISPRHPRAYFEGLATLIAEGGNSLSLFNDDVIIAANIREGKAPEDCRLYVGGGCQENVLENTEVNSRATIYLNLAQVLLMGLCPENWDWFTAREEFQARPFAACATFEELYDAFLQNLRAVVEAHIEQRNRTEREGWRYNPCPLHSATLLDCIENARDMLVGGARYNPGSIALTGAGTVIDALYALREVVFERKLLSLAHLREMLATDYAGEEAFRHLLLRIPKFGQDEEGIRAFSARVFADMARVSSGKANTRGGRYEASLFAFRSFVSLGTRTDATPDGRKAGDYLSPGMSPSPLALGASCSIGQILDALTSLDLTHYPVVAVLDVKLPLLPGRCRPDILIPVLMRFLHSGGSVLQMNYVDQAILLDAQRHPERHADLTVRISGYSAYFTTLPEVTQEEIIQRTEATVG